jgi:uncharacterized membrane protein YqhA
MLGKLFAIRYITLLIIIGSLLASLLVLVIATYHVGEAFVVFFGLGHETFAGEESAEAVALILESLDNYLLGFILLYFAYSMYFLASDPEGRERFWGKVRMPPGLQVASLGEMKKTILMVITVSLSVFLLRDITVPSEELKVTALFVPLSVISVALAIKLIDWDDGEERRVDTDEPES